MAEKKILIVDYDNQSLDHLAELFKPYEFQIIKATDGDSGYDKFISEKPDLVILEAMLPRLHGFDLAKKISTETKGKVPFIIVTGFYRGSRLKMEALSYIGASDYFEKPVNEAKFVESALNLLGEDEAVEYELTDTDSILNSLSKKEKNRHERVQKEESFEEKNKSEFPLEETEWDVSVEKAFSEINVNIMEEIFSLLEKKKKNKKQAKRESKKI